MISFNPRLFITVHLCADLGGGFGPWRVRAYFSRNRCMAYQSALLRGGGALVRAAGSMTPSCGAYMDLHAVWSRHGYQWMGVDYEFNHGGPLLEGFPPIPCRSTPPPRRCTNPSPQRRPAAKQVVADLCDLVRSLGPPLPLPPGASRGGGKGVKSGLLLRTRSAPADLGGGSGGGGVQPTTSHQPFPSPGPFCFALTSS